MQLANCLLSLGGEHGNTVPKFGVTAAEIAVLRVIHGEESVRDVEPAGEIARTSKEERVRLVEIYGNQPERPNPVNALFPGVAARVYERLDELDIPEEFYKAQSRVTAQSVPDAEAVAAAADKPRRGRPRNDEEVTDIHA